MKYEPCSWYKSTKHKSPLDNFIEERSVDIPSVYCDNDIQTMVVNYIQCVKLDDIEEREPWSPARIERIRKWATPEKLRRLKYSREEETGKRIIPSEAFHDIPMLSREYKIDRNEKTVKETAKEGVAKAAIIQEKFKISDGIHRINRARELCRTAESCHIDCILASVEEYVNINKDDTENVELNKNAR